MCWRAAAGAKPWNWLRMAGVRVRDGRWEARVDEAGGAEEAVGDDRPVGCGRSLPADDDSERALQRCGRLVVRKFAAVGAAQAASRCSHARLVARCRQRGMMPTSTTNRHKETHYTLTLMAGDADALVCACRKIVDSDSTAIVITAALSRVATSVG